MRPAPPSRVRARLGALALPALLVAACAAIPYGEPPATIMDIVPKGPPVARGVTNGVAWTVHAWTEDGMTCSSVETGFSDSAGCGSGGPGPTDLGLSLQNHERVLGLTGLVGERIAVIRVHYGDGSTTEHPTLPSPVPGTRVAAIMVRPAPVPTSIDGFSANRVLLATTDL